MDFRGLVQRLMESGDIAGLAANNRIQFGTPGREYLGATLLPERIVPRNEFTERDIKFRTVIAVDGDRYSPAQLREAGGLARSMRVTLGNSDIARKIDAEDLDTLIEMLDGNMTLEASMRILRAMETMINLALAELNEKQRWDAIVNATVLRRGDNGYGEVVYYPNPVGHRTTLIGVWSDPAYDPWPDIVGVVGMLRRKGYPVNRIVTSEFAMAILMANPNIANRAGLQPLILNGSGNLVRLPTNNMTRAAMDGMFQRERIPVPETYDLSYNTERASARFMPEDAMCFFATTGRTAEIVVSEEETLLVSDTMGYVGIGRAAGQGAPGRALYARGHADKPPRIDLQGWQTSLPIIQEPEALATLRSIR